MCYRGFDNPGGAAGEGGKEWVVCARVGRTISGETGSLKCCCDGVEAGMASLLCVFSCLVSFRDVKTRRGGFAQE